MPKPIIVVVDPISTGSFILDRLLKDDSVEIVRVWSPSISAAAKALTVPGLRSDAFSIDFTTLEETATNLKQLFNDRILHVVSLSEPGVETADELSEYLGVKSSNGTKYSSHRRNKHQQLERIREANLHIPAQQLITSFAEAKEFMETLQADVVLKPLSSAGSDNVFFIPHQDYALLETRFNSSFGKVNKMGITNDALIIQEFCSGKEFVIDTVSLEGQHKLTACWLYSKISLPNTGDFIYLGMELINPIDPKVQRMFDYVCGVLDALEIKNFAGHAEVIYNEAKGTVTLLEIGARPHGGGGCFLPLQTALIGYNLVDLFVSSLKGPEEFAKFNTLYPVQDGLHGFQLDMINHNETGVLTGFNQDIIEKIKSHPAFHSFSELPQVGKTLAKTIDCFTIPGSITFVGVEDEVKGAVELVRASERDIFIVEKQ